MACVHLKQHRCTHGAASERYGDEPSAGVCLVCPDYEGPSRGAGDLVRKALDATGASAVVKTVTRGRCNCAGRQAAMNRAIPFKPAVDDGRQEG